jgi:lipopolysaccharide export system permease protein
MAQFASRSEFTIMRVSGFSTLNAVIMLLKVGVILVVLTFIFGEYIAPLTFKLGEKYKISLTAGVHQQEFQSGLWTKDLIRADGDQGAVIGSRFLNVHEVSPTGKLIGVKIYELNSQFLMTKQVFASYADYQGDSRWRLSQVEEIDFPASTADLDDRPVVIKHLESMELISEITPTILIASSADNDTDRMSATDLAVYAKHLTENKQGAEKFEIAFWKKIIYPFVVFVMLALALPFAYLHSRSGGVSLKIFSGIMIGVSFYLLNSVFSHIGLLNTWTPFVTAILPSSLYLMAAMIMLWWVEKN